MSASPPQQQLFTRLYHEVIYSNAALCLSPGAFRLLADFIWLWDLEQYRKNGKAKAIFFTWTNCRWVVARKTWRKYRDELVRHGFIARVGHPQSGKYRMDTAWRTHVDKECRLVAHQERQKRRKADTVEARETRGKKLPPRNAGRNSPLGAGGEDSPLELGGKNSPDLRSLRCIDPPPLSPASGGGPNEGGGDQQREVEEVRDAYNAAAIKHGWTPCTVFDQSLQRKVRRLVADPEWRKHYPDALAVLSAYCGRSPKTFDLFVRPKTVRAIIDRANTHEVYAGTEGLPF